MDKNDESWYFPLSDSGHDFCAGAPSAPFPKRRVNVKMMQRDGSGRYVELNSPGPFKDFKEKPFFEQVLAYAHSLKVSKTEPIFLVFCSTEEWRVIDLYRQVRTDKRPSAFPSDHRSSLIRSVLDELLQPHGLVSELVPEDGDPDLPIAMHRLAITHLHRS